MKMSGKAIGILVAGALLAPAAAYAADSKAQSAVSEAVITTKVKAELAKEKPSTLAKVSVNTDNAGVVVLSGSAKTQADKDKAEAAARSVSGVTKVENRIEVKP
jgi:hyperosmotically inducible protein